MMQNEKYLKESIDILNRKFGEPLPTLEDTMKAHKLKKEGGPGSGPQPGDGKKQDDEPKSDKKKKIKSVRKDTISRTHEDTKETLDDLRDEYQQAKEMGDEEEMEKIGRMHNLYNHHSAAQKLALNVIETEGDFNIDKVKEVVTGGPEKTSSEDFDAAASEISDLIEKKLAHEDYDKSEVKQLRNLYGHLKKVKDIQKWVKEDNLEEIKEGGPGSGPQGHQKRGDYKSDSGSGGWKQKNRDKSHSGSGGWKQKDRKSSAKDSEKEMERKARDQAFKDMEKEFDFDFDESINERLSSSEQKLFMIVGIRMMKKARWWGKRYNTALAETIRRLLGGMQYIDNISDAPKKDQVFLKKAEKYWPTNKYSKRALIGMGNAFSKMKKNQQKDFVRDLVSFGNWKQLKKTNPDTFDNMVKQYGKNPLKEGPDDKRKAKSQVGKIVKLEQNFRKTMLNLEQAISKSDKASAKQLKVSYRKNVTQFMRDAVLLTKRMK